MPGHLSFRPHSRMEQLGSLRTDFYDSWYMNIFRKSFERIQISLKSNKKNGYFAWRPIYIFVISRSITLIMRNVSNKCCRENQNTHFVFNHLFFHKNRAVYEVMQKNIVQPDRPQITIWCMSIAWSITKATNTHSKHVILTAFPRQQWLHERASMLYVHWKSC